MYDGQGNSRQIYQLGQLLPDKSQKERSKRINLSIKEAFSLRDEIGTCLNIEVEIDMTDKTPFLVRPFHIKEEDKIILDKEMKRLCYLAILKEGFSAYSSLAMLISRKMTKGKSGYRLQTSKYVNCKE